jgi:hypothetical protein
MLDTSNIGLMDFAVALAIMAAGVIGYLLAKRWWKSAPDDAPFGVLQASAFGMVGLLLGFSFSLAVARFDQRRQVTVREANAIGTTVLRTDLLRPPVARQMRELLREYVQARIEFAAAGVDVGRREQPGRRSSELQRRMWALAVSESRSDPHSTMVALFVLTLNDTIDSSSEQAAALSATIPPSVLWIVVIVVIIATSLLGANFGRVGRLDWTAFVLFVVMFALVIGMILDLDRPQGGLIKVSLEPLQAVQKMLEPAPSSPTPAP